MGLCVFDFVYICVLGWLVGWLVGWWVISLCVCLLMYVDLFALKAICAARWESSCEARYRDAVMRGLVISCGGLSLSVPGAPDG